MMAKMLTFLMSLLILACVASAEMSSLTVAAVVKAFDEKQVTLQVQKRIVTVPRSVLKSHSLTVGAAIFVTLRGEQIDYLLPRQLQAGEPYSGSGSRQPASVQPADKPTNRPTK
jgi:hypothetical protein